MRRDVRGGERVGYVPAREVLSVFLDGGGGHLWQSASYQEAEALSEQNLARPRIMGNVERWQKCQAR